METTVIGELVMDKLKKLDEVRGPFCLCTGNLEDVNTFYGRALESS